MFACFLLFFYFVFTKSNILRYDWSHWRETKRKCISNVLGQLDNLQFCPHPDFCLVRVWNSLISGTGGPINMELDGCETIIYDHNHDLWETTMVCMYAWGKHVRNDLKFGMLVYADYLQNWLHFDHGLWSFQFWCSITELNGDELKFWVFPKTQKTNGQKFGYLQNWSYLGISH